MGYYINISLIASSISLEKNTVAQLILCELVIYIWALNLPTTYSNLSVHTQTYTCRNIFVIF